MPISTPFTAGIDMSAAPRRPSSVRAESDGYAGTNDLDDSAERIPFPLRRVDPLDHACLRDRVERAKRRAIDGGIEIFGENIGTAGVNATELNHVASRGSVEAAEKLSADRAGGDARRGLAR